MEQNINELLFMQLIMQNQHMCMISLGKLKNPVTDKIERNMEYAKMMIDTLDMLAAKTKGNLSEYEDRFLTEVLRELKLNYVDEINKDKKQGGKENEDQESKSSERTPEPGESKNQ
ncbi:MAG TPA: DUF1844 domain-containing protein [Ignavibacteriaceae bacterium]|nr:DUF1844 domain-containing protein [Ignavibacteriaceae bacterium]